MCLRHKQTSVSQSEAIDRWAVVFISTMETTSKSILYVSHIIIRLSMASFSTSTSTGNIQGDDAIKKHSLFLQDSSSDSESETHKNKPTADNIEDIAANEFFTPFRNKYVKKDLSFRMNRLKAYREDSLMQTLAKAVFDFSPDDKKRFEFLFETEGNLKLMWQFIFLSFMDQECLMLELRYKQHADDFNRINNFQIEKGMIAKKDGPKVYRLFKLFCLKDKVFNAFINRPKSFASKTEDKTEAKTEEKAMEIDSGLKLPTYTDTETMMDDENISLIEFMSRFEKFKVDEISIDEAEDDICFNAQHCFEDAKMVNLIGLRFTDDEKTNQWEKRKLEYTPALALPIEFQDFLEGDFTNKCSFLYALHPENINKEIMSVMGSAHIFVDRKQLKQKLHSALQKWFYRPEAFLKNTDSATAETLVLLTNWWKCSNTDTSYEI